MLQCHGYHYHDNSYYACIASCVSNTGTVDSQVEAAFSERMAGWQPFETESSHPSFLVSLPACPTASTVHVDTFTINCKIACISMWPVHCAIVNNEKSCDKLFKAVMKYYLPRKIQHICYLVGKVTTITTWQIPALTRYSPREKQCPDTQLTYSRLPLVTWYRGEMKGGKVD